MFVGGSASVDASLSDRVDGPCTISGCLDATFDAAKSCYLGFQASLAGVADTVSKTIGESALHITCSNDQAVRNYVSLTPAEMSLYTYTTLSNCMFNSEWVINVRGSDTVRITGDTFPGLQGAVVYNVLGSRNIEVLDTTVNGHLLSPNGNLVQTLGLIVGKVAVGNVEISLQVNMPNCPEPGIVEIPGTTEEPVLPGDSDIPMLSDFGFRAGDEFHIGQETFTIAASYEDGTVTLNGPLANAYPAGTKVIAKVDGGAGRAEIDVHSSSSILSISFVLVALLALLF
jgi:hypothetical protein